MDLVNISSYTSLAFLAFICFLDFKKNVPKQKPAMPFNIALFLFLIANSVLYIGLLPLLAGIELELKSYTFRWSGGDNLKLFRYREVSPLIIAVLYFGFGKAKIEVGNKEFSFYSTILSIFRSMFPRSFGVSKKLNEYIEKLGDETDKLYGTIGNFQTIAESYNWQLYKDEWKEINNTKKIIEEEIDFLMDIKNTLSIKSISANEIGRARDGLVKQIEKSRISLNDKLRYYLRKIITKNVLHEQSISEIVELINVNRSDEIIKKTSSNYIARAFGISFLCGIFLSTVFSFTGSDYAPPERILYLVTSFFFFLAPFTGLRKITKGIEGFSIALLIGAFAGFIGHFAFNLIALKSIVITMESISIKSLIDLTIENLRGAVIGTLSAAIAYFFKHHLNKKIERSLYKYPVISLSGGLAVLGVSILFSDPIYNAQGLNLKELIGPILTGMIVLMGISFVSGIFEQSKGSEESEKDTVNAKREDIQEFKAAA